MNSLIVSGLPRGQRMAVAGLAGATALAFAIGLALPREGLLHEIAWDLAALSALALCLLRSLTVAQDRGPWAAITIGLALRVGGALLGAGSAPPELMEAGVWISLSGVVPLYIGIGLLVSRQLSEPGSSFWLDGLIAALSIAAIVSAFLLGPLADGSPASESSLALALALPLGDAILLAMVIGLYSLNRRNLGAQWAMLAAAVFASLVGGLLAVSEIVASDELTSSLPTGLFCAGLFAYAVAAWQRPSPRRVPARGRGVEMVVPAIALIGATVVLVVDHFQGLSTSSVLLAGATIAAVLARGTWTLRDLRSLAAMKREALTDDLTDLPNRRALYRSLQASTSIGAVSDRRVALLIFDLDRFKDVNDALGHDVGDRLLRQVSDRLVLTARGSIVARIGSDEFALLCETGSEEGALLEADRLAKSFAAPFLLDGAEIHVETSIGVALFPDHALDASTLLRRADLALDHAKTHRSGRAVFSPERDERRLDRLSLVTEIETALEDGQLEAFYQPQIELATGRLWCAEALVRWRHPERGVLGPDEFLPVIEHTGLMRRVTRAMLTAAVAQAAEWLCGGSEISVAVNLSPTDLLDASLAEDIESLLRDYGVPAELLRVEVTEQAAVADLERGLENLTRLKALGLDIALDDFGTGQSSLAHLKRMPVNELKIDRSFLLDYESDPRDAALVTAAVKLGHTLGLRVVAEGVESAAAVGLLTEAGCDVIQGFLVSRPLSAHSFDVWRRRWSPSKLLGNAPDPSAG